MRYKTLLQLVLFCVLPLATAEAAMKPSEQPWPVSAQCPTGSPEAERLFQLAVDYHIARNGMPWDLDKAEKLYEEALEMGNAKAAINLGVLYRLDYNLRPHLAERHKDMLALYEKAVDMGCPEGLTMLAEAYAEGWGVSQNTRKADKLMRQAAEKGSLMSMVNLGRNLYDEGEIAEGKSWMEKALALGCGNAGDELATIYSFEKDSEKILYYLREGAKLGSENSIIHLFLVYNVGMYGQNKDIAYSNMIDTVKKSFDVKASPKPIPNFDELVPPRPVLPYKD